MIDQQIEILTKDGHTITFITHPERGGPFPVIIFYMDAPAIREELRDMARRLGTSGYYVMLPNLYYRAGVMELGPIPPDPDAPEGRRFVGVARYIANPDGESAEFAVVTADDWQRRGIAYALMSRLIACARKRGLARLQGAVLRANHGMLKFTGSLGFAIADDPDDPEQVIAHTNLYWKYQTAPGRTAGTVETADVEF